MSGPLPNPAAVGSLDEDGKRPRPVSAPITKIDRISQPDRSLRPPTAKTAEKSSIMPAGTPYDEEKGRDLATPEIPEEEKSTAGTDASAQVEPIGDEALLSAYPDGGLKAWSVVFGGFCAVFCGFGIASGIGGFQTLYRSDLLKSYSESEIAWITSAQAFVTFGASCFTGPMVDKYGPRNLVALGGFLLTLGFCMLSLCYEYYQICIVHVTLIAMGCDLMFICPIGVIGQWFQKRRGMAFGMMSLGSSVGAVVWPLVLANLPQRIGFGWTCRVMALISLACGISATLLLRPRLPPKPPGPFFYLAAFKNVQYDAVVVCFITWSFGFFTFVTFIGTYGQLLGLLELAPYLLIIQNACSAIGRLGAGVLADRIGVFNVIVSSNALMTLMYFVWLACKTFGSLIVLVVIFGITGGAFVCLQPQMATSTTNDMRFSGTLMGQALFVQAFAQLASGPSFGALIGTGTTEEQLQHFPHAIILGAMMLLVATIATVVARLAKSKKLVYKV